MCPENSGLETSQYDSKLQDFLREFYLRTPFTNLGTLLEPGYKIFFASDPCMKIPELPKSMGGNCYDLCNKLKRELVKQGLASPDQVKFLLNEQGDEKTPKHAAVIVTSNSGSLFIDPSLLHSFPINLDQLEVQPKENIYIPTCRSNYDLGANGFGEGRFNVVLSKRGALFPACTYYFNTSNAVEELPDQDEDFVRRIVSDYHTLFIRIFTGRIRNETQTIRKDIGHEGMTTRPEASIQEIASSLRLSASKLFEIFRKAEFAFYKCRERYE